MFHSGLTSNENSSLLFRGIPGRGGGEGSGGDQYSAICPKQDITAAKTKTKTKTKTKKDKDKDKNKDRRREKDRHKAYNFGFSG
jgi:hypothetical protein